MVKILSRSGDSLADIYDVEGSIAGIEQLETRELAIIHEMGATVLSERFTTRIFRHSTGAIAQNIAFREELTTLPETPTRLLGLQVITTDLSRLNRVAVLGTDPTVGQDIPLWIWDDVIALDIDVTMEDLGTGANFRVLQPLPASTIIPTFVGGNEQQDNMVSNVTLVGLTTGFGAGTVVITALLYLAFPRRDVNISSRGLPIPSW